MMILDAERKKNVYEYWPHHMENAIYEPTSPDLSYILRQNSTFLAWRFMASTCDATSLRSWVFFDAIYKEL